MSLKKLKYSENRSNNIFKTNKKSLLPVSYENIQKYKQQLMRSTLTSTFKGLSKLQKRTNKNNQQQSYNKGYQVNKQTFNEQSGIFHRAKGISHRIRSASKFQPYRQQQKYYKNTNINTQRNTFTSGCLRLTQDKKQQYQSRPSTQLKNHRKIKAKLNLLANIQNIQQSNNKLQQQKTNWQQKWIKTDKLKKSRYSRAQSTQKSIKSSIFFSNDKNKLKINTNNIQKQYLKKGTAIDRSLLINLLKQKYKQNIKNTLTFQSYSSFQNYSNLASNQLLVDSIKKQIPLCLRDTIGPEQMIKMSRILTGAQLRSVNLNDKIQHYIRQKKQGKLKQNQHQKNKQKYQDIDDNQTLQSIKRW